MFSERELDIINNLSRQVFALCNLENLFKWIDARDLYRFGVYVQVAWPNTAVICKLKGTVSRDEFGI